MAGQEVRKEPNSAAGKRGISVLLRIERACSALAERYRWNVTMKHTKQFLALALIQLLAATVAWAKPDVQLHDCVLHAVTTNDSQIVLTVSGWCTVLLRKDTEDNGSVGQSVLEGASVVIQRRNKKQDEWKALCAKASSLVSKKVWIDCESLTVVIEQTQVRYVSCSDASIGAEK